MNLQDLNEKLVAVLGFGQEGRAVTEYLIKHGVSPVLFDQKPWTEWPAVEQEEIKSLGVNFIFGPDCFKELAGFDVAFRSPGVRLSDLQLTTYNLQLTSQTKWFFDNCPAKIIGVTGTKGKGTTASLIYEILKDQYPHLRQGSSGQAISNIQYPNTYLTGNIGKVQPLEILEYLMPEDWVVYELSSFQLQDLDRSPHIGIVLMVTAEHLDYHKNIEEYHEAKTPIVKFQSKDDYAIANQDFPASVAIGAFGKGKKLFFSRQKALKQGCYVKGGDIVISGSNFKLPISKLLLKGKHNLENVCAAVLATRAAGCRPTGIKKAALNFKGLEYRLQYLCEKSGVKFYNDSFSTTPETAIAAIQSFDEPLIVILGGSSKNSDFSPLGECVIQRKNLKAIILIGQEGSRIKSAIQNAGQYHGKILEGAKNMGQIFDQIKSISQKGDVVALSPACASFDMFKNYKERGEQFKLAVKDL